MVGLLNPDAITPNGDGTYNAIVSFNYFGSSGTATSYIEQGQVTLANDGITVLSYVQELNVRGGTGTYDVWGLYMPQMFDYAGNKLIIYSTKDETNTNAIAIAELSQISSYLPKRNARTELVNTSLGGLTSLPAEVTELGARRYYYV
jgi:hypothetical protein